MNFRSIRTRLTLWYFAVLAAGLVAFGAVMWSAVTQSLYRAVDETLRDRVQGVRHFIEEQGAALSSAEIRDEFREHSVLGPGGDLFQVSDAEGKWLYRSGAFFDADVRADRPAQLRAGGRFENIAVRGTPLRLFSETIMVRGRAYSVQVAAPVEELHQGLRRFLWILLAAAPAVLGLALAGGYWMSRRALAPVDGIIYAARSIGAQNLARQRLPVLATGDELQRLSETLNAMFERLDAVFSRIVRFTADASHELRTPVALMRTTAELALRKERSEAEYREALAQILGELERTSRLIEDLLVLARADALGEPARLTRVDLSESAREACQRGETLARAKPVRFESLLPEAPLPMDGDAEALRRLFLVLIDNAVKYTPAGGSVRLSLAQNNGWAVAEIRDTGIGVSQEDLPHIFDRFYRADRARSRDTGGAGLGLAIARWIVEMHAGRIEVESEVGRGSTFRVRLPLAEN